jgi:hypothetical protein
MTKERLIRAVVPALALAAILAASAGCSDQPASTAQEDAAFKSHDASKAKMPPPDAAVPKGGKAFIGEPTSTPVGGGSSAPPPNAGAIPGAGGK